MPILNANFVSEINSPIRRAAGVAARIRVSADGGHAIVRRFTARVGGDGRDLAQYLAARVFLAAFCA
jgi:hypothetical protein